MDAIEEELRQFCFQAPRWMQIEIQAFWYGLLGFTMDAAEKEQPLQLDTLTVASILHHADPEFESWPIDWLKPRIRPFVELHLSFQEQEDWFARLDQLFEQAVPTDLNIFTVFANGEMIDDEQWERLYDTLAFEPPQPLGAKPRQGFAKVQKTRRVHGRRAITPLRRRRALTRHRHILVQKL